MQRPGALQSPNTLRLLPPRLRPRTRRFRRRSRRARALPPARRAGLHGRERLRRRRAYARHRRQPVRPPRPRSRGLLHRCRNGSSGLPRRAPQGRWWRKGRDVVLRFVFLLLRRVVVVVDQAPWDASIKILAFHGSPGPRRRPRRCPAHRLRLRLRFGCRRWGWIARGTASACRRPGALPPPLPSRRGGALASSRRARLLRLQLLRLVLVHERARGQHRLRLHPRALPAPSASRDSLVLRTPAPRARATPKDRDGELAGDVHVRAVVEVARDRDRLALVHPAIALQFGELREHANVRIVRALDG
ncbi:hypothetical protein GSI_14661 [Ganoderma sinense ZZ0214-1]|uniref:Uncharacterized protein n=1 Tax=Ganoderma sinense ZZ0214-1 TaxID=1077348 RepID=A0A2G8RPB0_9APHY|nr:hypothetical protein GSI_14661 [Ganoderma sinense ZZ0214-1]